MANSFCTAGKLALLNHLAGHVIKAALYGPGASLTASTPAYTATNELPDGDGYSAGGTVLTGANTGTIGTAAWLDFDDPTWPNALFGPARKMLIYDSSDSNRPYAAIDFGADKTGDGANFIVQLPAPGATAIVRI